MIPLILLLFLVAVYLLWQSGRGRQAAGLPGGRVIYTDTWGWGAVETPLYDPVLALTGRPDYLVSEKGRIIPVEVKSSQVRDAPYDEHIFQLAAYCVLVEKTYGKRPPYGIIHYPNRTFAVDYTPELEASFLDLLAEMRRNDRKKEVDRSHEAPARCHKCGFRSLCDQRLAGS